jgi:hypothetical protein
MITVVAPKFKFIFKRVSVNVILPASLKFRSARLAYNDLLESEYVIELFFISSFLSIILKELVEVEVEVEVEIEDEEVEGEDTGAAFEAGATCPG